MKTIKKIMAAIDLSENSQNPGRRRNPPVQTVQPKRSGMALSSNAS